MARFITGLFGSKQTSPPATALRVNTSLQGVPIALLLGGAQRLAGNLLDYFNFNYQNASSSGSGGKGGLGASVGKGQSGSYDYFASFIIGICEGPVDFINGMWTGGTPTNIPPEGAQAILPSGNFFYEAENFTGSYTQSPWGFTEVVAPSHALAYRGIVTANFGNYPLGSSPSLPNLTFELYSLNRGAVPGQPDGHASVAVTSLLTDPHFGLGFPAFRLDAMAGWQNYCIALGLGVSPVIASSVSSASFINDLAAATNSAPCWQDGVLTAIPYGDAAVTAGAIQISIETYIVPADQQGVDSNNTPLDFPRITVSFVGLYSGDISVAYQGGAALTRVATYAPTGYPTSGSPAQGQYYESGGVYFFSPADIGQTIVITYNYAASASFIPDTTPLYHFTADDFLPNEASLGSGLGSSHSPVVCVRKSRDQMQNGVKVEYLDRNNVYNPVNIEVKDEASITAFGRYRPSDVKQLHFFCLAGAAQQSATLSLIRQQIARTFQFTVGRHFMLILQLMKLYTFDDPGQGLAAQPGRLIEVQENASFSLTLTFEEFLGTVSAPQFGTQGSQAVPVNFNEAPGKVNAPIIFEPTDELNNTNSLGGLQIWAAVSGQNTTAWGGAFVWASYDDGENFQKVGEIIGPARMGVTSATLPAFTANPTGGQTIDTADTLSVDLSMSAGALSSGTQADARALNTSCYVGGEIVAYATATLTGANKYDLSYLVRGAYGTETAIAAHAPGTPFARLDANIFALAFDQSRIGATLTLKFQSFNIYQGGLESLADCAPYTYTITGAALSSPLPSVTNLRTVFDVNTGFTDLVWDDIKDFRAFKYEIRSGTSFASAMTLGQVAHPPFRVPGGNGTYWVAAVAQPVTGLTVYSEFWVDVAISGAVLTQNVVLSVDLKAANWPGTFSGGAGVDTSLNAIRSGGANILTDPNILTTPDILNYGGGSSGFYYPSDIALLDIGYLANVSVSIQYQPTGVPVGQNILAIGDILSTPDILGSASTAFINVYPLINVATNNTGGDLYALSPSDLYTYPDLYAIGDFNWGGFQRFSPGTYQARALDFAVFLQTIDPNTIAYDLAMVITATIPGRVDTFGVTTSASSTTTINFQPTGAASPAPFNGGPAAGNLPAISWGIVNAQAGDDLIITALSLSAITFEILNGGVKVVRNVTLFAEGF